MPYALALTALGGMAALYTSRLASRWPYALAKGVAAVGFVWVALEAGHLEQPATALFVVGLVLSGVGDVLLAYRRSQAFLVGMSAFALTHILYSAAFAVRGIAYVPLMVAAAAVLAASLSVWRWLRPHLPSRMVGPIGVYVVLGSVMVALAWASLGAGGPFIATLGATAFYLSDIAVARERFVSHQSTDKLWGLPLYYVGQTLIALSAG